MAVHNLEEQQAEYASRRHEELANRSKKRSAKPRNAEERVKADARRRMWMAILSVLSLFVLCFGLTGGGSVVYLALNPAAYKALAAQQPPSIRTKMPGLPTPTHVPDVSMAATGQTDGQGVPIDSYCPEGAPTFDFSDQSRIGTKSWIESLPKEPPEGIAICVQTRIYDAFMKVSVTFKSGIFAGQKMTGLDVLAYHYSRTTVGDNSRYELLKVALANVAPATNSGRQLKDTGWITLPGYAKKPNVTPNPLCTGSDCFEPDPLPTTTPIPPTATPFKPMPPASTATLTPMPTSVFTPTPVYADMVLVTPIPTFTRQPAVATAMQNLTADEWLALYEDARKFESEHCQHIYNTLNFQTMASSELWAYTNQLTWKNGQLGWFVEGNRRDVYVPNYGNYVIYSVCGYVSNVPSMSDWDGNGTRFNGGVSTYYAPGSPDPATGLIDAGNGAYWVNVYGQWFSPAYPKLGIADYETLQPYEAITYVNGWDQQFNSVTAVNSGDFPSAGDTRVLMQASNGAKFYVNFNVYLSYIGTGGTLRLDACSSGTGGYEFAGNNVSGDWCIFPGR